MSDVKQEIKFYDSMTADRRADNFAYLRKNALVAITPGLYPSKDFEITAPTNIEGDVRNIIGSKLEDYDIKIITSEGSTTRFYNLDAEGESNTAITTSPYAASSFGLDGVYMATANGKVYRVDHSSAATIQVGDLGTSWILEAGAWDDLYYWWIAPSQGMYRQLPAGNPIQVFNGNIEGFRAVDFFGNYMIIFTQVARDIIVLWWDKADNSFFYRRTKIKNSVFLAGGVVDGRLMLVHFIGNETNLKELAGEIVVSAWDGENFTRLNSIRAGHNNLSAITSSNNRQATFSTGAEVMEFAVDGNISAHNPDLYDNYIYRIRKDGRIEVRAKPETSEVSSDRASFVRVFHSFSLYAVNSPYQIYTNRDTSTNYDEYDGFTTTEYITNFIGNPYNDHKLDGLSISYEKISQIELPALEPVPGSLGNLAVDNIGSTTLDLLWTEATSVYFAQNLLEYKVYRSLSNNITTIADMVANGTMVQDWTANISSEAVSGLTVLTTYYFNIIVRDPDGNMAAYNPVSAITTPLFTDWTPATTFADVTIGGSPLPAWSNRENALTNDGTFATKDQGTQGYVSYYTFGLAVPGGATVMGIELRLKGKSTANPGNDARFSAIATKSASSPTTNESGTGSNPSAVLTSLNASYLLGGSASMWGASWTPAEVNAAGFGFIIVGNVAGTTPDTNFSLDFIEVRVFYSI